MTAARPGPKRAERGGGALVWAESGDPLPVPWALHPQAVQGGCGGAGGCCSTFLKSEPFGTAVTGCLSLRPAHIFLLLLFGFCAYRVPIVVQNWHMKKIGENTEDGSDHC